MRRALYVALAVLVVLVGTFALVASRHPERAPEQASTTTTTTTTRPVSTTTTTASTTTTVAPTTTTTVPPLQPGDSGPRVFALEQRLDGLGYFVGAVDGTYDADTLHGVTAFQKVSGLGRDGRVGPETETALATAGRPARRGADPRLLEVDLARQVLFVVDDGTVTKVLDVSTGKTPGLTPSGRFTLYRQIDGWRHAPLGVLYRPKYFWKGLAIHGYSSVPPVPASHGCIRVTNAEMDWLWASGFAELGASLWVH